MICKRCGNCCKADTMWERLTEEEKSLIGMVYAIAGVPLDKRCANLEYKCGFAICKIYKDRPWFCKEYFCEEEK